MPKRLLTKSVGLLFHLRQVLCCQDKMTQTLSQPPSSSSSSSSAVSLATSTTVSYKSNRDRNLNPKNQRTSRLPSYHVEPRSAVLVNSILIRKQPENRMRAMINRRLVLTLITFVSFALLFNQSSIPNPLANIMSRSARSLFDSKPKTFEPNQSFISSISIDTNDSPSSAVIPFWYRLLVAIHKNIVLRHVLSIQSFVARWIDFDIGFAGCLLIVANLWYLFMSVRNALYMQSTCRADFDFSASASSSRRPKVSVLLAARNEEQNIEKCLNSLLRQNYPDFEILVMNDDSTDMTQSLLESIGRTHPNQDRLRVFASHHLPADWYGKAYSVQQLARHATGDVFVVTDADTVHQPNSLAFCVSCLFDYDCDFVSGFPHQQLTSFGQRVLVPAIYLMGAFLLPLWLMDRTRDERIALAIGQLKVYRRKAFEAVDGYSSIRREVCEDVQMARLMKRSGYRIKFVDAKQFVTCNMYDGYWSAFQGIAKTYFSALDHNVFNFAFAGLFITFVCVPFLSLPLEVFVFGRPVWAPHLICMAIFVCSWAVTLYQRSLNWQIALYYPLLFVSLLINTIYAFYVQFAGLGFQWKDRYVK